MGFQHRLLLSGKAYDHRRHQALGQHVLLTITLYQPLIVHLLVGGVLVNHHQLVFEFHEPVGVEDLTDDAEAAAVFHGEDFFLEKVHLLAGVGLFGYDALWRGCLSIFCIFCIFGVFRQLSRTGIAFVLRQF